jgi:threonine/homoserine/homoserine lactone efflux protein
MPDEGTLAVFALAALALIVVPGPAVLYIVAQAVDGGRRAGLVSAAGVASGGLVHIVAAVVGISSLVAASATAFAAVKYAGAAYLVFLGVRRLLTRDDPDAVEAAPPRRHRRLFVDGFVVNVLNPKTALFFLAFLPQFVDPEAGSAALQAGVLGAVFVVLALASDSTYALAAGTAGRALRSSRAYLGVRRWVTGTVLVCLGLAAAFTGARRTAA